MQSTISNFFQKAKAVVVSVLDCALRKSGVKTARINGVGDLTRINENGTLLCPSGLKPMGTFWCRCDILKF